MYEGNKWDGFRDQLDEDLLTHLNGNAVYNVSHPCFRMILEKMEEENSGTQAFDVATRRIVREYFPYECEGAYKQTTAIDNLAATLLYAEEAGDTASYIHGAKMMDAIGGSITAVVSNFGDMDSSTTLQGLITGRHVFSDVLVVEDHGEPGAYNEYVEVQLGEGASSDTMRLKNVTRYPGSSPARDFCLALEQVETPYFAFSNVFRVPTNLKPIADSQGRIMVPCLPSSSIYCDDSCQADARGAALFTAPPSPQPTEQWFFNEARRGLMDVPLMPAGGIDETCVVNGDAMILTVESAQRFCIMLEEKIAKPSIDECGQSDATATSYLTYLQSIGEFEDEYQFYLKEQWGERRVFLPYRDIPECQDETELPQKDGIVVAKEKQPWQPVLLVPFSPGDYDKLRVAIEAFASPFEPFSSKDNPFTAATQNKIYLVLAFSRNLDDYPTAKAQSMAIQADIEAQELAWTRHFITDVDVFSCDNTEEEDTYKPTLQGQVDEFGEPVRWVAGPNRQFEKMMRRVMENIPDDYSERLVFMKEFDTVPQRDNHFGNLLEEVYQNTPFYVLGR